MIQLKKNIKDEGSFNQGVEAYNQRDFFTAVEQLLQAVQEHPGYADYHFALAMAQRELGDLESAIQSLQQALEINPDYVQAKNEMAILLAMAGQPERAQSLFSEVVSQFIYNTEDAPGALSEELLEDFQRGQEHLESGGYADAVVAFRKASNPKPTLAQTHFNQAVELFIQKELAEAKIEVEQAIHVDPYLVDAHLLSYKIDWLLGNYDEALSACRRVVKIAPQYPDLHYHLALTYRAMSSIDKARNELEKALDLEPEYGLALLELADIAMEMQDLNRAEHCLEEYSACDDTGHPRYGLLLGRWHEEQGQMDKARIYYHSIADDSLWGSEAKKRLEILESLPPGN